MGLDFVQYKRNDQIVRWLLFPCVLWERPNYFVPKLENLVHMFQYLIYYIRLIWVTPYPYVMSVIIRDEVSDVIKSVQEWYMNFKEIVTLIYSIALSTISFFPFPFTQLLITWYKTLTSSATIRTAISMLRLLQKVNKGWNLLSKLEFNSVVFCPLFPMILLHSSTLKNNFIHEWNRNQFQIWITSLYCECSFTCRKYQRFPRVWSDPRLFSPFFNLL